MTCFEEIEVVIDYIEKNIKDVKLDEISKIVGIPIGLYQRIFSYVCGISIAEYIKLRRLTLAALDLKRGENKIIDIALEYGYNSHSSFTRAFKEHLGIQPSLAADENSNLNLYPRFSFGDNNETYYVVKGKRIMAELIKIEYEHKERVKLIGISKRTDFYNAGGFWREYFESGAFEKIGAIDNKACEYNDDYISLGCMRNFDDAGVAFDYTIGKYFEADTSVPEGLSAVDIPEGTIARAKIKGELNEILNNAYFLITEAIKKNGYVVDYDNFYWCDVYTYDGYCKPADNGEKIVVLDYFMPCKKENK